MSQKIDEIIDRIEHLEDELRDELAARQDELSYTVKKHRVYFEKEIVARHKKNVENIFKYLLHTPPKHLLTAPVIYSLVIPGLLLDLFVTTYQWVCFPVYKIKKVKRSDYIIIDRHYLRYLNLIEKLNCVYCGYMNGLFGYVTEVAAQTEQYWCPIKHANQSRTIHSKYKNFVDYGDAERYRKDQKQLREQLKKGKTEGETP